MRLATVFLITAFSTGSVLAQTVVPIPNDTDDKMNIIDTKTMTLEEAFAHPDVEVVEMTPDGLRPVNPGNLESAQKDQLIFKRRAVLRLEDRVERVTISDVPILTPEELKNVVIIPLAGGSESGLLEPTSPE